MPTPVGHALGGLAVAWVSVGYRSRRARSNVRTGRFTALTVGAAAAAVAPDLDILFHSHRSYTHSAGAMIVLGIGVWLTTRLTAHTTFRSPFSALWLSITIAAAYGSHVVLDWLGKDTA